ncbi:MAG: thermonuclease family protein [Thermomicrobiales bacterium]
MRTFFKRLFTLLVVLVVAGTALLIAIQAGWLEPVSRSISERIDRAVPDFGPFKPKPAPAGIDRTGMVPASWAGAVPDAAVPATVTRLADGDSIEVRYDDGREEGVRILLIDAPETAFPVECYSKEARVYLDSIMPVGSRVYLEPDVQNRDRYGRELREVWMSVDGVPYLVNENIVLTGHAVRLIIPPNLKYADQIGAAQGYAKTNAIGLWGPCAEWGNANAE